MTGSRDDTSLATPSARAVELQVKYLAYRRQAGPDEVHLRAIAKAEFGPVVL